MNDLLAEDRGTVLLAINVDQNEDASLIQEAWRDRGLNEPVAIAPAELTQTLLGEFGPAIVTPPLAPIVLISADQTSARLLPSGVKSAEDLQAELAKGR